MKISVAINKNLKFLTQCLCLNAEKAKPSYTQFPKTRGVYIFHTGQLNKNWLQANILYIGATNKQKINERISINYRGKIRPLIDSGKVDITEIYVSYCEVKESEHSSFPYLIERALLYAYQIKNNNLPQCNRE